MEIDAIGSLLNDGAANETAQQSRISQDEFIRLFLAQLQFQDPLEPLNNREFLAQMAQFSSLEQTRLTNQSLENLVLLNSTNQATQLLSQQVEVVSQGSTFSGVVTAVEFDRQGPSLTVQNSDGDFLPGIRLSQVRLLRD